MTGNKRITIYRDPTDKFDLVEIKLIGDPNTVIYKMKDKEEQIKQEFPDDYNAYYKNKKPVKSAKKETPLTKLKSLNINKKKFFEMEGITSIEQLAGLSDGACHGLGKDVLDHRKEAKQFLAGGKDVKAQQPVVGE
tara:strand:+ start:391 stop:798 length:408 start_codon:yes stop_codon:yes gene_type:complete